MKSVTKIKIFLLIVFIVSAIIGFGKIKAALLPPEPPLPPPSEECVGRTPFMSGYAWSDKIGWIKLRSDSGALVSYGVDISYEGTPPACSTDLLGYAWSENIGWITFNESELAGCPSGTCKSYLGGQYGDPSRPVIGWARACYVFQSGCSGPLDPERDNWDGWIRLSDTNYGIDYNSSIREFEGWAWSSDLGWISFNCTNQGVCSDSTYRVTWGSYSSSLDPVCDSLDVNPFSGQEPLSVLFTGQGHDQDTEGIITQYRFYTGEGSCGGMATCFATNRDSCLACGCTWDSKFGLCTGFADACSSFGEEGTCNACSPCSWNETNIDSSDGSAEYTYNSAGTYCAKLRVQDDDEDWSAVPSDCPDTCSKEITVSGGTGNNSPACSSLTRTPSSGEAPLTVNFTAQSSDSDGTISEFLFDFGDGNFTTVPATGVYSGTCSGFLTCHNIIDPPTEEECEECPMCYWDPKFKCLQCGAPPYMCAYDYECTDFTTQSRCEACNCSFTPNSSPDYYEASIQHTYTIAGSHCAKVRAQDDEGAWSAVPGDCPDTCSISTDVTGGGGPGPENNSPVLDWTGESGYVSEGLEPEIGGETTSFDYRVEYTDQDGDAPNFVRVYIEKSGVGIAGSPFNMSFVSGGLASDCKAKEFNPPPPPTVLELSEEECNACGFSWNPIDHLCGLSCCPSPSCSDITEQTNCEICPLCDWSGTGGIYSAIYSYTTTLSIGTDYTYYFEAQDSQGANAVPTTEFNAPDVSDTTNPSVDLFNISPTVLNIDNPTATINWTVSDMGGSHLSQVEVWRASDDNGSPGAWQQISIHSAPVDSDNWSDFTVDSPPDGIWWYGLHVYDLAGNQGIEFNPPGPIRVTKDTTSLNNPPTCDSLENFPSGFLIESGMDVKFVAQGSDLDGNISSYQFDFDGDGSSDITVSPSGECSKNGGGVNCSGLEIDECTNCGCCYDDFCGACLPLDPWGFGWPSCLKLGQTYCESCGCVWSIDAGSTIHNYPAGNYCTKVRVQDDSGDWSDWPSDCLDSCAIQLDINGGIPPPLSNPPTADMSCQIINCSGPGCECDPGNFGADWTTYSGENVMYRINNLSTDDNGVIESKWSILGWQDPFLTCSGADPLCFMTIPVPTISGGDYDIKLEVKDGDGQTDTIFHSISIKQDAVADFKCSLRENGPWQDCLSGYGFRVSEGEMIYFKDYSSPSAEGTAIISRLWEKSEDGGPFIPFSSDNETNPSTTLERGSMIIRLTIIDDIGVPGRVADESYTISVKAPPPQWRESPVF